MRALIKQIQTECNTDENRNFKANCVPSYAPTLQNQCKPAKSNLAAFMSEYLSDFDF